MIIVFWEIFPLDMMALLNLEVTKDGVHSGQPDWDGTFMKKNF
jgi:hypothetical protein